MPVQVSPYQDVLTSASTWYAMSPYLGQVGDLPAGVTSLNQCGEYYHMAHNHALQFATNFGASFGGQMTLIRIDPAARLGLLSEDTTMDTRIQAPRCAPPSASASARRSSPPPVSSR